MRLTWYGHASFRVEGRSEGGETVSVVTDPYTPETAGYPPVRERPDIVITSSVTDDFHDRADLVPGPHTHVNALDVFDGDGGARDVAGLRIEAVEAAEAEHHPSGHPDRCAMYAFRLDGLRVAHMGDVGNPLSARQIDFLRGTDVLLALAGGFPTIALPDLRAAIEEAKPRLVVPMHFRTLSYAPRNTHWIDAFLGLFDEEAVRFACAPSAEITSEGLPERTGALVLDYLRRGVDDVAEVAA